LPTRATLLSRRLALLTAAERALLAEVAQAPGAIALPSDRAQLSRLCSLQLLRAAEARYDVHHPELRAALRAQLPAPAARLVA
jgi:hypothetical protein